MTNPYESPGSSAEPDEPAPITGKDTAEVVRGFFWALGITILCEAILGFPLQQAVMVHLPRSLQVVAFLVGSPAVFGPACSAVLWWLNRRDNRPFAVGAVAFGVAAFLLMGVCLLGMAQG